MKNHRNSPRSSRKGGALRHAFIIAVWLKGLNGALELVGGLLLLLIPASLFHHLICSLALHDLGKTPKDFVFRELSQAVGHLTGDGKSFALFYFLGHGIVKVFLSIALLRGKRWSYPVAVVVFLLFLVYEAIRWSQRPSVTLALAMVVDLAVTGLIWHHYRSEKRAPARDGYVRPA